MKSLLENYVGKKAGEQDRKRAGGQNPIAGLLGWPSLWPCRGGTGWQPREGKRKQLSPQQPFASSSIPALTQSVLKIMAKC